jgi:hypothetical protein
VLFRISAKFYQEQQEYIEGDYYYECSWINQFLPECLLSTNWDVDWKDGIRLGALLNGFNNGKLRIISTILFFVCKFNNNSGKYISMVV